MNFLSVSSSSYTNLLEFNKLLTLISGLSNSEASGKAVLEILPLGSREEIEARQNQIREIMRMSSEGRTLGLSRFPDLAPLIMKARPDGAVLEGSELSGFMTVLYIASEVSRRIRAGRTGEKDDLPHLGELTSNLTGFPDLLGVLKRSIDSEGNILDTASSLLADLREQIRRLESRIQKKLEELVRDERVSVFLQDDFITKRSGRWVIPVRMDSKGQVAGVVHDVSKSGETAFMEPLAIINLANELENLVAEQKAEEIRILRNISSMIRKAADGIDSEYKVIVYLDLLNCIAKFAVQLKMELPLINDEGAIRLVKARHPLLLLSFGKKGEAGSVVPLDVDLGRDKTIMVITGSNAGGKTIAIKTIGLLLVMALSGMPAPADSSSSFPIVRDVLVDIGDEQSIESNLSTFSAHVSNISGILKHADAGTLVLIDELGTGTDPDEGAALACAVLKELRKSGALVFATTHLADIKGFVHRTEGMLNASMEFDQKTFTPLYRLRIGEPGQSHALETAKRYGLPESIIESARAMLGGIKVEFDNLVADLSRKRASYEEALKELDRQKTEMDKERMLTEEKLAEAEKMRKETLAKTYKEASEIILATKKQMRDLLEELKKRERAGSRELIKKVEETGKAVSEKLREYSTEETAPLDIGDIKEGDLVFVKSLGYDAFVTKVMMPQGRLKVRAGSMEIEIPASEAGQKTGKSVEAKAVRTKTERPDEMPSSRINLVGMRVDEAISKLEPFLNHASLAGLSEVTIIHGFGTGALSRAVREHLEGHPLVKKFRKGEQTEGGGGVTVATIA